MQFRPVFAQATIAETSFEEPTTGSQYVDTGDAGVDHALVNNSSESPGNYTSTGGELGFSSFYFNTRNDVGLTDGDFVGVTSFTGDVGSFPDGTQGFQMQDADGKMQTSLDAVDISSFSSVQVSLALFVVETGWEADDVIHIFVETDAGTVDLLNTAGQDIDDLGIEGSWQTLQDALPVAATTATLHFALDSNAAAESIYLDNIQFTGEVVSTTPVLVINEIMQNPSAVADDSGEWFELYNPTNAAIDIDGWTIRDDGSDSHVINNGGPLNVPASGYLVLCNNATSGTNGGLACDYSYGSSWFLANGDDEVVLLDTSATEIDRVTYDGGPDFPDPNGASMCLTDPTADNNIGSNWVESTTAYGGGDLGTPGAANDCIAGAETAPSVTTTTPTDNATDVPVGNNITINFSENVNLTANAVTLECPSSTAIPFTGLPASDVNTIILNPDSDLPADTVCTVTVVAAEVTDADSDDPPDAMDTDFSFSFTTVNPALACTGGTLTLISAIQGNGAASGMAGSVVTVEGVVIGDFQDGAAGTSGDLNGFYLQEETADEDGNEATSEGIFVFQGSNPAVDVAPGNTVRVTGQVAEFNGLTELTSVTTVEVCPTASTIADVTQRQVTLPYTDPSELERYENMYVLFPQALVISEYFNYDRFGEIVLAQPLNGEDRPYTPTAIDEPGTQAAADRAADNLRSRITLDDGLSVQNPDPVRHPNGADFSLANTFRGGDQVQNATGVLTYDFGIYRIQPTAPANYIAVNPRPTQPDAVGGTL
ncbi:MAG: lamin tail domain-containing protein, partial [Caldilineaceae bacterium]|nr:lamin tail domain-containing protein [Caldilineaceae bacterium]